VQANTCRYNIPQALYLRGGSFDFSLGGGLEDFKNNFLQPKERKKKSCNIQSRKKISCKRERSKKIPACKSTEAFHFSIVSTGLQDFAFLSS
jgi:hypothetical protein